MNSQESSYEINSDLLLQNYQNLKLYELFPFECYKLEVFWSFEGEMALRDIKACEIKTLSLIYIF